MSWLIPRDELTEEQIRGVELNPYEHRAILGAPGSGKTQILLHRACYLSTELKVSPERFRIFVFTDVLQQYMQGALKDLNLACDSVVTLDDWCTEVYERVLGTSLPRFAANRRTDYATLRKIVHKIVRGKKPFDFVLIDEAQDLDGDAFSLLRDISSHVTVAIDTRQQIRDDKLGERDILRALGVRRGNVMLLDAFRCCPYIVRVASEFIEDGRERMAFRNQTRLAQTEIQTPLLHEAEGFENERDRLIEILRERQFVDRTIGILFARKCEVESFANALREARIDVETKASGLDFANQLPKVLTIRDAKGLSFDSVFLPRLVRSSFPGMQEGKVNRFLFVAMTRAKKWLYMSTVAGKEIPAITLIRELSKLSPPPVTIKRETYAKPHKPGVANEKETEKNDPFSFL